MTRLLILMAVTLTALYLVLGTYGAVDRRAARQVAAPSDTTPQAETTAEITSAAAAPGTTEATPPPEDIEPSGQAEEQPLDSPGPALRRAPDHTEPASPTEADAAIVPEPDASGKILYVTGNRVNFRAGPSTNNRVIGALQRGDPVEALGPTDTPWINIRDAEGRIGYMSAQFLSNIPPN